MADLIDAARTVIVGATLRAGAIGAALAFVGAVVVGTVALQPPKARPRRCTPVSRDSRAAGEAVTGTQLNPDQMSRPIRPFTKENQAA